MIIRKDMLEKQEAINESFNKKDDRGIALFQLSCFMWIKATFYEFHQIE